MLIKPTDNQIARATTPSKARSKRGDDAQSFADTIEAVVGKDTVDLSDRKDKKGEQRKPKPEQKSPNDASTGLDITA